MNKGKAANRTKAAGDSKKVLNKRNMLLYVVVTIALICIFFAFGSLKKGYHVDEMYTFGLSNHLNSLSNSIHMFFYDGKVYTGQELWDEYLTVKDGGRFDYINVYINQASDVHPPLYYFFIHTVSSLLPELSLLWTGLVVNVIFDIIIYWQLVWMNRKLGLDRVKSMILSAFYVLCVGFIGNAVVFFRMYALLAVWINFLVMLFFSSRPEDKATIKYYWSFAAVLFGGLLTQYYFLIFAFFACLVYAVFVILAKNRRKLILSLATAGAACVLWLMVWPVALVHIFIGYRGTEAMESMLTGAIWENLWSYIKQINSGIFGGLFVVILAVFIVLFIIDSKRNRLQNNEDIRHTKGYQYALLIIPVCMYVVIIAKIAPYRTLRYVISVSALLYTAFFGAMINMAERLSKKAGIAVIILGALVLLGGYRNKIDNLYTSEAQKLEALAEYKDTQCLYLYNYKPRHQIYSNLLELRELNNIVFMTGNHWQEIIVSQAKKAKKAGYEEIVVYINNNIDIDHEDALAYIKETYGFSESTKLFTSGYANCYVLKL